MGETRRAVASWIGRVHGFPAQVRFVIWSAMRDLGWTFSRLAGRIGAKMRTVAQWLEDGDETLSLRHIADCAWAMDFKPIFSCMDRETVDG